MAVELLGKFIKFNNEVRIRVEDIESYFPVDPINPARDGSKYQIYIKTEQDSDGNVRVNAMRLNYDTEIERDDDLNDLDALIATII